MQLEVGHVTYHASPGRRQRRPYWRLVEDERARVVRVGRHAIRVAPAWHLQATGADARGGLGFERDLVGRATSAAAWTWPPPRVSARWVLAAGRPGRADFWVSIPTDARGAPDGIDARQSQHLEEPDERDWMALDVLLAARARGVAPGLYPVDVF